MMPAASRARESATLAALQACLTTPPSDPERRALSEGLRGLVRGPSDPLGELAERLAAASERRELALAAAQAMRLLSQRAQESEPEPGKDAAIAPRRRDRRERASAAQERALRRKASEVGAVSEQPVESLPGIGRVMGVSLRARGLHTLGDLAWLLPLGYQDERRVVPIGELRVGERQLTEGLVVSARMSPRGRARRVADVILRPPGPDEGARLRLTWFRVPAGLLSRFREGERFRVVGTVESFRGELQISHPQTERLAGGESAAVRGLVPRYPVVPGVPPRALATAVARALARCAPELPDAIPEAMRAAHGLGPVGEALVALHHPPAESTEAELASFLAERTAHHERLALEEFFVLELALHRRRVEEQGILAQPLPAKPQAVARARAALPFQLTAAQEGALAELCRDLASERPMRRLLQGDVGSGKTAVAMLAAAQAAAHAAQVAFMAPTEVLAEQHFRALAPLAQAMGLRAALVLGGERAAHRRKTRKALEEGTLDLAVGTHALLTEGVRFAALGLVIVDEQHRFGVGQRLRLVDKGPRGLSPHLLVMTATPIPRTLTLALHGDLAASVIAEMPPGRVPPTTRSYPSEQREAALRQLERGIASGGQAFVVCPAIEPNEETGARSALEVFEELSARLSADDVELLHGRQKPEEKQRAMERFASGQARLLVTTTVVEVGVDVPRANVMLIEDAHRFGLAQLHQLRGRVGRGGQRSACLLVHDAAGEDARARIRTLCDCSDGFRIAEEDLRLRGPGELFGRRQSGLPGFRFGDLRRDAPLLERARALAHEVIECDPSLEQPEHAGACAALAALAEGDHAVVKEEAG